MWPNLGANNAIKGRTEKGTALVVEALRERGYMGEGGEEETIRNAFLFAAAPATGVGLFAKVRGWAWT